jgi:hypothetical protein
VSIGWSKFAIFLLASCLCVAGQQSTLHLRGMVTDSQSHLPVSGANVSVAGGLATRDDRTDTGGSFDLPLTANVRRGDRVRLRVQKDGYEIYDNAVAASEDIVLQVPINPAGQPKPNKHPEHEPTFRALKGPFAVTVGTVKTFIPLTATRANPQGLTKLNDAATFKAYVEDDKLYVDAVFFVGLSTPSVQVAHNEIGALPPSWDSNFDDSALEIVDANRRPRLQLIYEGSEAILRGLFTDSQGNVLIESDTGMDFNPTDPFGANSRLHPLFKYPSSQFRGKRGEQAVIATIPEASKIRPYKDVSNEALSEWADKEASKLLSLSRQYEDKFASANQYHFAVTPMRSEYLEDFNYCCRQAVVDLRAELFLRLGPAELDRYEQIEFTDLTTDTIGMPGFAEMYAPYLKKMADDLRQTNSSKPIPPHPNSK